MSESFESKPHSEDLVVVGSSAGGVGALSTLVSTLNKSFPAPIVLAQHLDPQRPSHLGSILERRSVLPIVVVSEDAPTALERGKVYVVPANRHVRIRDGHVHLEADHADRPKPLVDMLFVECRAGLWRTPDRGDSDRFRLGWRRGRGRREGRRRCRHHSKSTNRGLSFDASFIAAHSGRSRG